MEIISHRGFWIDRAEANTYAAFERAVNSGYGIETDFRDCLGKVVIAHDMPTTADDSFERFLDLVGGTQLPLALNIKADGLASVIGTEMRKCQNKNWFVFDMSIPDMRSYLSGGSRVFTRLSEVETDIPWADRIQGIWLDAFDHMWFNETILASLLDNYAVCVVSPELHGRDKRECWALLRNFAAHPRISLCTDFPADAERFFQ